MDEDAGISTPRIIGRPFPPGVSGNPSGRPALKRAPSKALAELNDTDGLSPEDVISKFIAARGNKLCGADFKAIQAFRREVREDNVGVAQLDATMDRLEGKVAQRVELDGTFDVTAAISSAAEAARGGK